MVHKVGMVVNDVVQGDENTQQTAQVFKHCLQVKQNHIQHLHEHNSMIVLGGKFMQQTAQSIYHNFHTTRHFWTFCFKTLFC